MQIDGSALALAHAPTCGVTLVVQLATHPCMYWASALPRITQRTSPLGSACQMAAWRRYCRCHSGSSCSCWLAAGSGSATAGWSRPAWMRSGCAHPRTKAGRASSCSYHLCRFGSGGRPSEATKCRPARENESLCPQTPSRQPASTACVAGRLDWHHRQRQSERTSAAGGPDPTPPRAPRTAGGPEPPAASSSSSSSPAAAANHVAFSSATTYQSQRVREQSDPHPYPRPAVCRVVPGRRNWPASRCALLGASNAA
jgi:hypothetical protein